MKHIKEYKIFELSSNDMTDSEKKRFPSELDISEFFYDITDNYAYNTTLSVNEFGYTTSMSGHVPNNLIGLPYINLNKFVLDIKDINIFYECLERLYEATGFRPIGEIRKEDFVDEESGDIVSLFIIYIKLYKVNDIQYHDLTTSVFVDNPNGEYNKELVKKFL